jgi:integration host factor subunit alpha
MEALTRAGIAEAVYKNVGISLSESLEIVDNIVEDVCLALESEGEVKISSFGTFTVNTKSKRIGRNPKTKKEAVIAARKVVSFYSSNILNDNINKA